MNISANRIIGSALALVVVAALMPAAQAYTHPKKRYSVTHHVVHRPGDIYVSRNTRSYLDPGPSADVGTEDRYFSDTRYPHYLLGPGIFQRFLNADGEYN
jgi:hypothetical protein